MGPDPDRILLVGSAAVAGVGVASHEVGVGGYLARQLSAFTDRGVDIDLIGAAGLTTSRAAVLIKEVELLRYDAVVLMLGAPEALSLTPLSTWTADIRALLDQVRESAPYLAAFVVGVAPLSKLAPFHSVIGPLVTGHIARINAATERLSHERGVHFIDFAPRSDPNPDRFVDASTYAAWAEPIARYVATALNDSVPVPHRYSPCEVSRQSALDGMEVLDSPPTAELDAITRVARDLFGVLGAAVNLIDRDRQYTKAVTGFEARDVPRDESFCTMTVELGGLLVIGDTTRDDRVSGLPATIDEGIRFYAGYPVESPDGQRVGTLCLFDTEPRNFTASDASLLRELALRVQRELWKRVEVPTRP